MLQKKSLKNVLTIKIFVTIKIGLLWVPVCRVFVFRGLDFQGTRCSVSDFWGSRFRLGLHFLSIVLIRSSLKQLLVQKNINGFCKNYKTDVKLIFLIFHESQNIKKRFFSQNSSKNLSIYTNITFYDILTFTSCLVQRGAPFHSNIFIPYIIQMLSMLLETPISNKQPLFHKLFYKRTSIPLISFSFLPIYPSST